MGDKSTAKVMKRIERMLKKKKLTAFDIGSALLESKVDELSKRVLKLEGNLDDTQKSFSTTPEPEELPETSVPLESLKRECNLLEALDWISKGGAVRCNEYFPAGLMRLTKYGDFENVLCITISTHTAFKVVVDSKLMSATFIKVDNGQQEV